MQTYLEKSEDLRDFVHSLKIGKEKENPIIKAILELEVMYKNEKKEYAIQALQEFSESVSEQRIKNNFNK